MPCRKRHGHGTLIVLWRTKLFSKYHKGISTKSGEKVGWMIPIICQLSQCSYRNHHTSKSTQEPIVKLCYANLGQKMKPMEEKLREVVQKTWCSKTVSSSLPTSSNQASGASKNWK